MSGIIGSKFNHRGSGLVGSLGTDGQHMLSSGAGKKNVFETVSAATYDDEPIKSDITALALREATNEASAAFNLPNQFIETFTDDTNLGTQTTGDRTSGYWSSIYSVPQTSVIDMSAATGSLYTSDSNAQASSHTNWTAEAWIRTSDMSAQFQGVIGSGSDHYGATLSAVHNASPVDSYMFVGNGSWSFSHKMLHSGMTTPPTLDTWVHVAMTKSGTTYKAWFGGIEEGSATGAMSNTNSNLYYGSAQFATWYFKGYMTGIRVSDVVRYSSTFTPSTVPFVSDSDTLVLINSNTSNGSTTFTDTSSNGYTINVQGSTPSHTTGITSPLATGAISATGTLIQSANVVASDKTTVGGTLLYKDNGSGSTSLGTDLKIYFTCDGDAGSPTWTEAASYNAITPVYSTGVKQVRLGETTCTLGDDIRYRAVFANQASGTLETQLHGIGINY